MADRPGRPVVSRARRFEQGTQPAPCCGRGGPCRRSGHASGTPSIPTERAWPPCRESGGATAGKLAKQLPLPSFRSRPELSPPGPPARAFSSAYLRPMHAFMNSIDFMARPLPRSQMKRLCSVFARGIYVKVAADRGCRPGYEGRRLGCPVAIPVDMARLPAHHPRCRAALRIGSARAPIDPI